MPIAVLCALHQVDAALEFVNHFAHYESIIAFDYTISISGEKINNNYGAIEVAQSMKKYHQTERFRFNIDEGKIESFLEQRGLRIIEHLNNYEIEKTLLLNDNGSLKGQITGLFRFAMVSPINDLLKSSNKNLTAKNLWTIFSIYVEQSR